METPAIEINTPQDAEKIRKSMNLNDIEYWNSFIAGETGVESAIEPGWILFQAIETMKTIKKQLKDAKSKNWIFSFQSYDPKDRLRFMYVFDILGKDYQETDVFNIDPEGNYLFETSDSKVITGKVDRPVLLKIMYVLLPTVEYYEKWLTPSTFSPRPLKILGGEGSGVKAITLTPSSPPIDIDLNHTHPHDLTIRPLSPSRKEIYVRIGDIYKFKTISMSRDPQGNNIYDVITKFDYKEGVRSVVLDPKDVKFYVSDKYNKEIKIDQWAINFVYNPNPFITGLEEIRLWVR